MRKSSATQPSRSVRRSCRSRKSPKRRTNCKTGPSSPERRSTSRYPNSPMACVNSVMIPWSWNGELRDSWSRQRLRCAKQSWRTMEMSMGIWTWTWNRKFRPLEEQLRPVDPDRHDSLLVWPRKLRRTRPTSCETLLRDQGIGWQRQASLIGTCPLRNRNGCWQGSGRAGRPKGGEGSFTTFVPGFCIVIRPLPGCIAFA